MGRLREVTYGKLQSNYRNFTDGGTNRDFNWLGGRLREVVAQGVKSSP